MTPHALIVARGQEWRVCTLAMVAGYADAYGLRHYQTFVSFMSGNTTQSGVNLGLAAWPAVVPTITAITCFVGGVFTGTLLAHTPAGHSPRSRFALVAVLMAGVVAATARDSAPTNLGIAMLSFAMGVMNTTLSMVGGQAVALSYVTGTLNALAQHLALACTRLPLAGALGPWDTHGRRALVLTGVWGAFLAGAALSTAASGRFGVWVLLLPVAVLAAFAAWGQPVRAGTEDSG
jgi:uncharacterized membrane protein YoaK (UPF0700 family)